MIVFDPATNHACLAIELRRDGKAIYIDQTDGSRIVCEREAMNVHPVSRVRRIGWPLTVHGPAFDLKAELRKRMSFQKRQEAAGQAVESFKANFAQSPIIRHIRIFDHDGSVASIPLSKPVS